MSYLFSPNTNVLNSNSDPITNTEPLPVTLGSNTITINGNINVGPTINVGAVLSTANVAVQGNVSGITSNVAVQGSLQVNNFPATQNVQVLSNTSNYIFTAYAPTWQLDALSKLRTSQLQTQFWHVPAVDDDTLFRFTANSVGTNANVQFLANTSEVILSSGNSSIGYTIRQTRVRYKIVPGVSHTVYKTVNWYANTTETGITRRTGLFTANNGLFWEQTANTLAVVVRRLQSNGLVTEDRVYSSNFNVDKLDGSGPSGFNIFNAGLSNYYTFWFDFIGGRTGRIRFGLGTTAGPTIAHTFNYSGAISTNFVTENSLPLRSEIFNSTSQTTSPTLGVTGDSFHSEAPLSFDPFPATAAHISGYIPDGTDTAILTFGLRSTYPYVRADITPKLFEIIDQNNQGKNSNPGTYLYQLILNANVNGTYAYAGNSALSNANTGRASQYWTWSNTAAVTGGIVLKKGIFGSNLQETLEGLPETFNLGTDVNGNPDTITFTLRQLTAGGSTANIVLTTDWLEQL